MNPTTPLGERKCGDLRRLPSSDKRPWCLVILTPQYSAGPIGEHAEHYEIESVLSDDFVFTAKGVKCPAKTTTFDDTELSSMCVYFSAIKMDTLIVINGPSITLKALGFLALIERLHCKPDMFYTDGQRASLRLPRGMYTLRVCTIANYLGDQQETLAPEQSERHMEACRVMLHLSSAAMSHGLRMPRSSAAATSYQSWLTTCQRPTPVIHDNAACLERERLAYTTGWTEALYYGKTPGPVYCWDIKSAYPWAATMLNMPRKLLFTSDAADPTEFLAYATASGCDQSCLFASVQITNAAERYPLRRDGETAFVTGTFQTVLCGPELLSAIKRGDVTHVFSGHGYDSECYLKQYLDNLLHDRQLAESRGEKSIAAACKALLVSLIGKFGERGNFWDFTGERLNNTGWTSWGQLENDGTKLVSYRAIGPYVQRKFDYPETATSFPAIPAIVNSAVRLKLKAQVNRINGFGSVGNRVYHVATDAVHVDAEGNKHLEAAYDKRQELPGLMRPQWSEKHCEYWGPNTYMRGEQLVAPGLFKLGKRDGMTWSVQRIAELESHLSDSPIGIIPVSEGHYTVYRKLAPARIKPDGFLLPERIE